MNVEQWEKILSPHEESNVKPSDSKDYDKLGHYYIHMWHQLRIFT